MLSHGTFELPWHLVVLHGLAVAAGLSLYVVASHGLRQRRNPSAAIAWVVSLALIPYVALPLYLMFGTRKLGERPRDDADRVHEARTIADDAWPERLAEAMRLAPAATYRSLSIHDDGAKAFAALEATIAAATRTLDVCTFLIGSDALGDAIEKRLIARASAGVRVRLLIDGIGRYLGGHFDLRRLRRAGIEVAIFVPPLHWPSRGRANLRNHRKMVIADDSRLWCGGRNFAAEYFVGAPGLPAWRDLSFDFEGELVAAAADRYDADWNFATGNRAARTRVQVHTPSDSHAKARSSPRAQLIPSGPDQADDTVHAMLVTAFFNARTRIVAVSPYFVPDDTLLLALTLAARRKVAVDLLVPRHSNHRLADIARHRSLRALAQAGARVWFLPEMIHAKAVVVDGLALAGSVNLDARSLFLNYEMMVAFYDPPEVERFAGWIARQQRDATRYVPHPPGLIKDLAEGLILWAAFQL